MCVFVYVEKRQMHGYKKAAGGGECVFFPFQLWISNERAANYGPKNNTSLWAAKKKQRTFLTSESNKNKKIATHQIAYRQHMFKVRGHGVVLHGHEEGVEDDTDGDG